MSVALSATGALVRLLGRFDRPENLHTRAYPVPAPPPAAIHRRYVVRTRLVQDRAVLTLTPRAGATGQQLLYLHGGAYVHPIVTAQWWIIDQMTRSTGVTVTVPMYRLAPEGAVPAAYALLERVNQDLADRFGGAALTLAGDSAGGALALGQALTVRDAGRTPPKQVLLLSPWLDIALTNPAAAPLQRIDPMLTISALVDAGAMWRGDVDPRDPRVSPVHADLAGLPPVHLFQGGRDVLAPDAVLGAKRLQDAGNTGSLHLEPHGFHNYVGAPWTPEAQAALTKIRSLLRS